MTVEFRPLSKNLGVEAIGVDLSKPMDDETFDKLHQAWLDHGIMLFRGQDMDIPQQKAFVARFGELWDTFTRTPHPDHPEVSIFSNIKQNGEYIGNPPEDGTWHSDFFYHQKTAAGSMFYAKEVPPEKGDTHFAGMTAAYYALPEETKARIDGLKCNYSLNRDLELIWSDRKQTPEQKAATPDVVHPVVRTHPETGRKALFLGFRGTEAAETEGMPVEEGRQILDELREFATQPQFVYTQQWKPGDAMLWDNRCTLHRATLFDVEKYNRLCYRVTVRSEQPY